MTNGIVPRLATLLAATLLSGAAFAHKTDRDHWFEHQRSLTDGGTVGIIESEVAPFGVPARAAAATPEVSGRMATARTDCLTEQMKATDGYVSSEACHDRVERLGDRRWIVDEDKQLGRHAERARAR